MGVKDLWSILSPSCEKKSLWELEGLTIAIDLSSWIVDSQNIGDSSHMNMYLRNLFFRTSYLLLLGVKPVFVLEGKAPELKHNTIARRKQILLKESQVLSKNKSGNRGRLNCLQKKCEELLLSLGVRCYKSEGEAEALCSYLNEQGIVDAVISQDSDCFLYGARTVLRNFKMSPTYTCDMYTLENIEAKHFLGRQKLLALSLLCGCDYESGVQGVGKQSALKFLATIPDDQVLNRLRRWRTEDQFSEGLQMTQEDKLELKIRKKALEDPSFPSEQVISEFLSTRDFHLPNFVWTKPSLPKFMMMAERMLAWEEEYIYSKFLPLVTRWHLTHEGAECGLTLEAIIKKRLVRGVVSYELRWKHDGIGEVITTEPAYLVSQVYTELHDAYVKSKEKPKKGGKGRKKETQQESELENVETLLEKLNISEQKVKRPTKKRAPKNRDKGLQTLDKFVLKEVPSNILSKGDLEPVITHSTPVKSAEHTYHYVSDISDVDSPLQKINFLKDEKSPSPNITNGEVAAHQSMNLYSFNDLSVDSAALDLSDIVNSIVSRPGCNPAVQMWTNKAN